MAHDVPMRKKLRRIVDAFGSVPPAVVDLLDAPAPPVVDPLAPSVALLAKLGFIAVRACSLLKESDPMFERLALDRLLADKEITEWVDQMAARGYIPKRP